VVPADTLETWLSQTASGDEAAFRKLYDAASPHLFALLLRMLKDRTRAEEALQDVFVRIWQKADTYSSDRGKPLTWLLTIARYRALDLLRRQRPEDAMPDDPDLEAMLLVDEDGRGPGAETETREAIEAVRVCMERLQDEQRRSVLMAYYEGLTHSELADRLKTPIGTVKSWIRRGLLRLRECLAEVAA